MNKLRSLFAKFQSFMQYRYTRMDAITWSCIVFGLAVGFVGRIVMFKVFALGLILQLLEYALMFYGIWRPFSKGIWQREKENRIYTSFMYKIKNSFVLFGRRIRFIKSSVFRVCPHCKAQIKLPRKRGKHTVKCPRCSKRFDVKIAFGKK